MRITKKFQGNIALGKRVYHPSQDTAAIEAAAAELRGLKNHWLSLVLMSRSHGGHFGGPDGMGGSCGGFGVPGGPGGPGGPGSHGSRGGGGDPPSRRSHSARMFITQSIAAMAGWERRAQRALESEAPLKVIDRLVTEGREWQHWTGTGAKTAGNGGGGGGSGDDEEGFTEAGDAAEGNAQRSGSGTGGGDCDAGDVDGDAGGNAGNDRGGDSAGGDGNAGGNGTGGGGSGGDGAGHEQKATRRRRTEEDDSCSDGCGDANRRNRHPRNGSGVWTGEEGRSHHDGRNNGRRDGRREPEGIRGRSDRRRGPNGNPGDDHGLSGSRSSPDGGRGEGSSRGGLSGGDRGVTSSCNSSGTVAGSVGGDNGGGGDGSDDGDGDRSSAVGAAGNYSCTEPQGGSSAHGRRSDQLRQQPAVRGRFSEGKDPWSSGQGPGGTIAGALRGGQFDGRGGGGGGVHGVGSGSGGTDTYRVVGGRSSNARRAPAVRTSLPPSASSSLPPSGGAASSRAPPGGGYGDRFDTCRHFANPLDNTRVFSVSPRRNANITPAPTYDDRFCWAPEAGGGAGPPLQPPPVRRVLDGLPAVGGLASARPVAEAGLPYVPVPLQHGRAVGPGGSHGADPGGGICGDGRTADSDGAYIGGSDGGSGSYGSGSGRAGSVGACGPAGSACGGKCGGAFNSCMECTAVRESHTRPRCPPSGNLHYEEGNRRAYYSNGGVTYGAGAGLNHAGDERYAGGGGGAPIENGAGGYIDSSNAYSQQRSGRYSSAIYSVGGDGQGGGGSGGSGTIGGIGGDSWRAPSMSGRSYLPAAPLMLESNPAFLNRFSAAMSEFRQQQRLPPSSPPSSMPSPDRRAVGEGSGGWMGAPRGWSVANGGRGWSGASPGRGIAPGGGGGGGDGDGGVMYHHPCGGGQQGMWRPSPAAMVMAAEGEVRGSVVGVGHMPDTPQYHPELDDAGGSFGRTSKRVKT
ncbi:unnamed protein product [Phaeothamnion confervicola]